MFLVFLILIATTAAAMVTHIEVRREKEKQLLFVGQQYLAALQSYSKRHAKAAHRYPQTLSALLRDNNGISTHRDLRRLYQDPMTDSDDWGLIKSHDGGILGVFSKASGMPLNRTNFPRGLETLAGAKAYSEWVFRLQDNGGSGGAAGPSGDAGSLTFDQLATRPTSAVSPAAVDPSASAADPDDTTASGPAAAAPPSRKPDNSCGAIEIRDQAVCAQQYSLFGAQAGNDCTASAAVRAAACATGTPLPGLYLRTH